MIVNKMKHGNDSKIIILGDASVGKTSILIQFNSNHFETTIESTVGASFSTKVVETANGPVELFMWDTAGQEKYRSLIPMYTRSAVAAIIVVDITRHSNVNSLDMWHDIVKQNCGKTCRIYIVANKFDLISESEKNAALSSIKKWAEDHSFPFFATSAKQFETVQPVFQKIADDISLAQNGIQFESTNTMSLNDKNEKSSGCCG